MAGRLRISESAPLPGYRPCVGMMVVNPAGLVFIGERRGVVGAWQMPQGGIDRGEPPRAAALRELVEEIGTDRVELARESSRWYAYDLPPEHLAGFHGGRYRGQSQKWFAFQFAGRDADIDIRTSKPEFRRWRWAPSREVIELIVPFKRAVYEAVFEELLPGMLPRDGGGARPAERV
ncbi:MAG TPA: RNA pyrophosphohydrolase [Geminicoccaceae bacterium]|nr:RNA pyrophosphohydrolase [Geminicoccaceae bacterium]